jgi:hypothetical protein
MSTMSVTADGYTKLDRSRELDAVQKEFERIINGVSRPGPVDG